MLTRNRKKMRRMTKRKRGGVNTLPSIKKQPEPEPQDKIIAREIARLKLEILNIKNPITKYKKTRKINKLNNELYNYIKGHPSLLYPKQPSEKAKKPSSGSIYGFPPEEVEKAPSSGTRYGFPIEEASVAKNKTKRRPRPPPIVFTTTSSSY